jgi:predicted small lipoprotein YifL
MVKVVGVSSLVVILRLFTVGGCGAGSLLVGDEQVQMNITLRII